jgi:4-diphosphocytidyl-2-C-methyl-D-erythritol kinase
MLPLVAREYAGWTQVWAPAKVNLFLRVVGKRADGYHELATHMLPVPIYDTILARPAGQLSLQCDDPGLPVDSGNLVMKAAWMLQERYAPGRGAEIELRKRIPHQAGMGGGSSDAAAALVCLNFLWKLGLGSDVLASLALELGSDVPFFLGPGPAWCTGRGENLTPMAPAFALHLVVVKPREGLSTREIFAHLGAKPIPQTPPSGLEGEKNGDLAFQQALGASPEVLARTLRNDLETPSCQLLPALDQIRAEMLAAGALGVVMTGSGSAMVALAADAAKAVSMAQRLKSAWTPAGPVAVFVASSAS